MIDFQLPVSLSCSSITVCGEAEALDILVESGADPGTADVHGAFPLHYAAQMCGSGNDMGNDVRTGLTGADAVIFDIVQILSGSTCCPDTV